MRLILTVWVACLILFIWGLVSILIDHAVDQKTQCQSAANTLQAKYHVFDAGSSRCSIVTKDGKLIQF